MLEQVHDQPRVRLELELGIPDLLRPREHLGRGRESLVDVRGIPQRPPASRQRVDLRLRVLESGGDIHRLLAQLPHPAALRGEVDRPAEAIQQPDAVHGALAVRLHQGALEQPDHFGVDDAGLLDVTS